VRTVEVWQAGLAQPATLVHELEATLSGDERDRAARLASSERWIVARAALRIVLAGHLEVHPSEIEFGAGPHGKPELVGAPVRFNLSHSGDLALIALTARAEVGVDVERTSRRSSAVERTLTDGERATLDGRDRHLQLLRLWCRKEALAKAMGGGLGWAPETFDTSCPEGYALIDQELEEGIRSVAAPLRDRRGRTLAAVNVGTHAARVTLKELRTVILPDLLSTARDIEHQLAKR